MSPAEESNLLLLSQTFPSVDERVLRQALCRAAGDVNTAAGRLLAQMSANASNKDAAPASPTQRPAGGIFEPRKRKRIAEDAPGVCGSSGLASTPKIASQPRSRLRVIHAYTPQDVARLVPCTLILNVLDKDLAARALQSVLAESESWTRHKWYLFERLVESSHPAAFYYDKTQDEARGREHEFWFDGKRLDGCLAFSEGLEAARSIIAPIVNSAMGKYPKHLCEHPGEWWPNAAVANRYTGAQESIGWHADKLCEIGPRPTIASLTLGATRSFRMKRVVDSGSDGYTRGTVSIQLPHNSLIIMHPPCQELFQHCIPTERVVRMHAISGATRINLTFRMYRPEWSTHIGDIAANRCRCGAPGIIRCVKNGTGAGHRYFRACQMGAQQMGRGCGWFSWRVASDSSVLTTEQQSTYGQRSAAHPFPVITAMDPPPPLEFLQHLHPVIAIIRPAGIDAPSSAPGTPVVGATTVPTTPTASATHPSRRTSLAPTAHHRRTSSSTNTAAMSKPAGSVMHGDKLIEMLIQGLTAKPRDVMWDALGGRNQLYRCFSVSHGHQFVPIKPKAGPNQRPEISPLSPLNLDSPAYPDGILPVQWMRRHLTEIPAIAVGIFLLWDRTEHTDTVQGPLGVVSAREREMDDVLAQEILEQKRRAAGADITFAAVVVLKRSHLGDQAAEERLVAIRRTCQLDSRTGFFVMAPGDVGDVQVFITTLQKGLHETALLHYRDLTRRCKKRRSNAVRPAGQDAPHPLVWQIRAEFKMAVFAEFRQDLDSAMKHLESAHRTIAELFSARSKGGDGAAVLRRGTQRWSEALTLADCISYRMTRIYLYNDNPVEALQQLKRHIEAFRQVHDDRGIRSNHFEYLAWMSRQYRLFADLVDVGMRFGLKLPNPSSLNTSALAVGSDYRPFGGGFGGSAAPTGVNPTMLLQHPGFYYLTAASIATERRKSFRKALEDDGKRRGRRDLFEENAIEQERSVDHAAVCVELLTKSYEHFKRHKQGRMTLYLASEIADEYFEAGKHDMALKHASEFFDRIAKNYRKEKWTTVLRSILQRSLDCAKRLRMWEKVIEYQVELLSETIDMSEGERAAIQQELMDLLNGRFGDDDGGAGSKNSSDAGQLKKARVDMDQISSFLTCDAVFRRVQGHLNTRLPFQILLHPSYESPPMPIEFDRIEILFNRPAYRHVINACHERERGKVRYIDAKGIAWSAGDDAFARENDLLISRGSEVWIEGDLDVKEPGEIKVCSVSAYITAAEWELELVFKIGDRALSTLSPRWMNVTVDCEHGAEKSIVSLNAALNHSVARISRRQPKLDVLLKYTAPVYLQEQFTMHLVLTNSEPEPIQVWLAEAEARHPGTLNLSGATDYVGLEPAMDASPTGRIADEDLGVLEAGATRSVTMFFCATDVPGDRVLITKIRYRPVSSLLSEDSYEHELLRTMNVVAPFDASFDYYPVGPTAGGPSMGWRENIEGIDTEGGLIMPVRLEETVIYTLLSKIRLIGPWSIDVSSVDYIPASAADDLSRLELVASSTAEESPQDIQFRPQTWSTGQTFHTNMMFTRSVADATYDESKPLAPNCISPGQLEIIWRRRLEETEMAGSTIPFTRSTVTIPGLQILPSELVVIPQLPAFGHTDEAFPIAYTLWNRSSRRTQDITVYLDTDGQASTSADAIGFVWSGYKQVRVRIPPGAERVLRWNLYPVRGGRCRMPRLRVEQGESGGGGEVLVVMMGKEVWVKDRIAQAPRQSIDTEAGTKGFGITGPTAMEDTGILYIKPRRNFVKV